MSEHHRTSEWATVVRTMRPIFKALVDAGMATCIDCGRPILPSQRWQVGHIVPAAVGRRQGWSSEQINDQGNLGPTHSKSDRQKACNQIAGGKLGAQLANGSRREAKRLPAW